MNKIKIEINKETLKILSVIMQNKDIKNEGIFKDTIYITILNIKDECKKTYNLSNSIQKKKYFQKYFYLMNELFLSFNAYLVQKYIQQNQKKVLESDWESIFIKKNNKNKVTYLINFFIKKENLSFDDIATINLITLIFNFYENLFRNQISHGWINVFSQLNDLKIKIKIPENLINNSEDHKDIMKLIESSYNGKTASLMHIREAMKQEHNNKIKLNFITYSDRTNKKIIKELGVDFYVEDSSINYLIIEYLLNKLNYTHKETIIDSIKNINSLNIDQKMNLLELINEKQESDNIELLQLKLYCYEEFNKITCKKTKSLSLNYLLNDIILAVLRIIK